MITIEKVIEIAADKGFRTVVYRDRDLWIVAFRHTQTNKWSLPYSGFTIGEATQEAYEDIINGTPALMKG